MESDISLIEVAGEDDSLLQQIPEDDLLKLERKMEGTTAGNSGFFLCSPLLIDRSNATAAGSSTASSADYTDKENINANNIEGPKLSIMPQQMKRKKKAGGYNLRKSLAWNKAFFTDEGVLDSAELSMITGSTITSCGEALGSIDEEIPTESSGGCYNNLSLKDKLFKDTSTSTPCAGRKNGRCLLPKRGSSTKDNVSQLLQSVKLKEPSAKDVNRSGSKRGSCPRPVASSSIKRPTTSTATNTVNKEERISRIPVPKRDHIPTVISRAPRNAATIRTSDARSNPIAQRVNQVAQRVGSIPKMTMLKGSSINAKRPINKEVNANKSLKAKSSIDQPRRKLANPVLKVNSSRSQYISTDSNEGLKAATNSLTSKPLPSNDDGTKKVSPSITQNAPQTQMAKPSGLRMPSPSMGFFGQKKVSSFQSVPPDTSELHDLSKSNIPNVRIAAPSNPICKLATLVPRNVVKASHGEASGETNVVSCSGSGSSLEPVSLDRPKSALKVANIHSGNVNVVGPSTMNTVLSTHELEKPDVRSLSNPVLEHLGDVTRIHDEIHDQLEECQPHRLSVDNFGDSTKSHLDETIDLCSQGIRKALDDQLSGAQDWNDQSSEQAVCTNSSNCKIERTSPDHERLGIGTCNSLKRSRSSIEFDHGRFEDVSNDSSGQESCSFDQDEALETHKVRILRTRKAEASDLDHCISNECNNTMQSTSALSNSDSMHIDDEIPTAPTSDSTSLQGNCCSLASQNDYASRENEGLSRENNDGENKLDSQNDRSSVPHSTADACLDIDRIDRNCKSHTDEMVDIGSNMQQNNTFLEVERNQNNHGGVEIPCHAEAETLPINRDLHLSDTVNQLYEAHIRIGSEHVQNEEKQNSLALSVNDFNQLPGFSEVQNSSIDLVSVSPKNNQGKCSIDDLLDGSKSDNVIESSDACTSECLSNCNPMPSPKDNSSIHEEICKTRTGDNILESLDIGASLRSSSCSTPKASEFDRILSGEGTSETMSKEIIFEARTTCNDLSFCSPTKDLGLSIANDDILSSENVRQYVGTKELDNLKSPEMNVNTPCQNESQLHSEMDHLLKTEMCSTYNDNIQSEARTTCNDPSFSSPIEDLGLSIANDDILSSENVQQYVGTKELDNHKSLEMNGITLFQHESELNNEMDHLLETETCSTYNDNAQSEARTACNDPSFLSPTEDLGLSIANDDILSSENVQQCVGTKELDNHKSPEINGIALCQNETELNSEMNHLPETEMCSPYSDNAQLEARTTCNDLSFCSPTKDLDSSIPNDDVLSRENSEQYMEAKELEDQEMNRNTLCQNESEDGSQMDHLLDTELCSTYNDNAQSETRTTCNDSSFCSSTKDLGSSIPNDDMLSREKIEQYMEAKEPENHKSPKMNENILFRNESELSIEMGRLLHTETCSTYDGNSQSLELRKSEDVGKQNVPEIKTSTNAVPFSEEWLAALEAAGEEILTMKTGAVQNSPPDKSQPEPGPWSPVKRKNNQGIGPFDCTKCTKSGLTP